MSESTIIDFINTNFWVGCIGALAPEALRLYKLRTNAVFKWNPSYLICTLPFVVVGGFIASLSEPTAEWSAFYSGLCAPVLINTAAKDAAKVEKELVTTRTEIKELESKSSEAVKENEKLQAKIQELQATLLRLAEEKRKGYTENLSMKDLSSIINSDSIINNRNNSYGDVKDGYGEQLCKVFELSTIPAQKKPRNISKQMLLVYSMLGIAIVVGIFTTRRVYPTSLFVQIIVIVLTIICLIYLLRNNKLFKEYLKGL
jgi:regulator of replication initiation timing